MRVCCVCIQLIKTADETAQYLKAAIVQVRLNETTGTYRKYMMTQKLDRWPL